MLKIFCGFRTVICALAMVLITPAHANDCTDFGKLGTMLGQIERQCPGYRLTPVGYRMMLVFASKIEALGGEACAAKGKIAMLQDMEAYPRVGMAAASGDATDFNLALCDGIFRQLSKLEAAKLAEKTTD
jgi:hypothetical protein